LAETAASYFELPSLAQERLIVIATPPTPDPRTISALLDGVASAPWIALRTASDTATALAPTEESIRMPIAPATDRLSLAAARAARRTVDILASVLEQAGPVGMLERLILTSESADWI